MPFLLHVFDTFIDLSFPLENCVSTNDINLDPMKIRKLQNIKNVTPPYESCIYICGCIITSAR